MNSGHKYIKLDYPNSLYADGRYDHKQWNLCKCLHCNIFYSEPKTISTRTAGFILNDYRFPIAEFHKTCGEIIMEGIME